MRNNPWRFNAPPGWRDIREAPRDGTVIETQNNYGVAPTFGLHQFVNGEWQDASQPNSFVLEGPHLSWREYKGDIAQYRDPTGGAQNTRSYWLTACGYAPNSYGAVLGETFEQERARTRKEPLPASATEHSRPTIWDRMRKLFT